MQKSEWNRCDSSLCFSYTNHFLQDLEVRVSQAFTSSTPITTAIQTLIAAVLQLFSEQPVAQAAVTDLKMSDNNCVIVRRADF